MFHLCAFPNSVSHHFSFAFRNFGVMPADSPPKQIVAGSKFAFTTIASDEQNFDTRAPKKNLTQSVVAVSSGAPQNNCTMVSRWARSLKRPRFIPLPDFMGKGLFGNSERIPIPAVPLLFKSRESELNNGSPSLLWFILVRLCQIKA